MVIKTPAQAGESELKRLEVRIDEMIQASEFLAQENNSLRKQHATLLAERARLLEKTEQARTRVELIIQRLKAMEQ